MQLLKMNILINIHRIYNVLRYIEDARSSFDLI